MGISYSVAGIPSNKNSQLDDEKISANIDAPLTVRAEVKNVDERKVVLNVYATNTWNEQIEVNWGGKRITSAVWYLPNGEWDSRIFVYYPYHRNMFSFINRFINTKFKPGEERLLQTTVFFGLTNIILPMIARGNHNIIESFPWLPDGEYRFDATINPYRLAGDWHQYHTFSSEAVYFHFGS